jgi:hypothetical protein
MAEMSHNFAQIKILKHKPFLLQIRPLEEQHPVLEMLMADLRRHRHRLLGHQCHHHTPDLMEP